MLCKTVFLQIKCPSSSYYCFLNEKKTNSIFYFRVVRAAQCVWSGPWTPLWSSPTTSASGWWPSVQSSRTSSCPRSLAAAGTTWPTTSASRLSANLNDCVSCTLRNIPTTSINQRPSENLAANWAPQVVRLTLRVPVLWPLLPFLPGPTKCRESQYLRDSAAF